MSARLRWLTCVAIATLPFLHALSHAQSKSSKSGSSDPSQQAAIIEDVRTTVRFEDDGASQETMRQQVKIQSEAGLKEYGIITFGFIAGSQFSIDTVEVHKKDGTIVKAGPANTQEVTPEISRVAPMYSDIRQKQVTVPGLAIGDEVIFQYTTRKAALVPNQFWFQYSFAKTAIVLSESVEVNVPTARKLKMHCQPGYKPVITENGDRTIYRWHGSNDKIQDPEKLKRENEKAVLGGNAPPPSLELSTFESWAEIGAWYYELEHDRATPSPQIKSKALELTKGLDTPEARVKALYQFVSSNFRYISLDFGIGRYQPHAADEVLANGYGDCKDKHTLLAALLQAVGIQAFPALISTNRQLEPEVPSPAQFDHLITAVPLGKELTFLDTTAEVAPFGMLLSPLRHKKALVVRGQTAAGFVETPADPPFLAKEVFELNGKINDAGTLEAEVSYFLHGDTEVLFKNAFRQAPPAKYKDIVQFISYTGGFGGDVSNVKVEGLNAGDAGLRITYHYHRPDYFDFHDDPPRHSLPLAGTHLQKWGDDEGTVRLYTAPGEITYKCKVELPAGVTVQAPLPIKLNRDYAQYESNYSAEKNILTGERRIKIVSPEISGSHRQDYEALRRAVESDEGQEAVLRLPAGFAARPGEVSANDMDELMQRAEIESRQREYADALADLRKVAEKDPKHKGVWTKMAMVEGYMRHYDQAIKDFEKAIQLDPYDAQAHAELGAAYLSIQKGGQAVDELKESLEIDPLSHRAHYLLGWYYAIQKQDYASAVPELEKALATEGDNATDEAEVRGLLSTGYFKAGQTEKAIGMVKAIVDASPDPATWNNMAYLLAENSAQLDLARQYANSALQKVYERLNGIQPDSIRSYDLVSVAELAMFWDTMGWVNFKAGDTARAEKYVLAAWTLSQDRIEAEHLGEIYEKIGRRQEAIRFYAMGARPSYVFTNSKEPDPARDRLVKLVGRVRAEKLIQEKVGDPSQLRTVHLGPIARPGSKGEFYFLLAPGPKLLAIQQAGGDDALKAALLKQSGKIAGSVVFPEGAPNQLIRQGLVDCSSYNKSCDLVFYTSDRPTRVNLTGR